MAASIVSFFLAMVVVATAVLQATAASPPPPPPPTPISNERPKYCVGTLLELSNCAQFLTLATAISGPPANCCAPLRAVLGTPASICLCHLIGGEIDEFFGITIDPIRLALLPVACWAIVPPQLPAMCFLGPVPPISNPAPPVAPTPPVTPPSPMPPTPPVTPPSPPMRPLP